MTLYHRMLELSLWFSTDAPFEVLKTEFKLSSFTPGTVIRCTRGKGPGRVPDLGYFQWSAAVQALAWLAVRRASATVADKSVTLIQDFISGRQGSAASSLDAALTKKVLWLADMFGVERDGSMRALSLIKRTNSGGKRKGPIIVSFDETLLPPSSIKIYLGNSLVTDPVTYQGILESLETRDPARWAFSSADANLSPHQPTTIVNTRAATNPYLFALETCLEMSPPQKYFGKITVRPLMSKQEIEANQEIDKPAYGPAALPDETFYSWVKSYPDGIQGLFREPTLLGAFGFWPVTDKWLAGFRSGTFAEKTLGPKDLSPFKDAPSKNWYIAGIVMQPKLRATRAIKVLLIGALKNWLQVKRADFPLNIYALGYSDPGDRLLRRLGFKCIKSAAAMADKAPLYQLSMQNKSALNNYLIELGILNSESPF